MSSSVTMENQYSLCLNSQISQGSVAATDLRFGGKYGCELCSKFTAECRSERILNR